MLVSTLRRTALAILLCGSVASAQQPVVEFAGADSQLAEFVERAARHLDLPVTYAPHARLFATNESSHIKFDRPVQVPKDEMVRFLLRTLRPYDLTMVRLGAGRSAHYLIDSLKSPTVLRNYRRYVTEAQLAELKTTHTLVVCVVPVQHVSVRAIQTQIQRLVAHGTHFNAVIPVANSFIVSGFAPDVHTVRDVIRELDQPASARASRDELLDQIERLKKRIHALEALTKPLRRK